MTMPTTPILPTMADTLVADTAKIAQWRQTGDYDYSRDFNYEGRNFFDMLKDYLSEGIDKLFDGALSEESINLVEAACVVGAILLLVWIIYKVNPTLFAKESSVDGSYDIEEDNIYGIDFDERIAEAMSRKNYRETVRLLHLQTLKVLTDSHFIDWQPYKTPTQYTREHPDAAFRQMTNTFLYVRYGNGKADETMVENMRALQKQVIDGLPKAESQQEGGEQ